MKSRVFAPLAATLLLSGARSAPDSTLDRMLAFHDRAVGGPALRAAQRVEYDLSIEEQGMILRARSRAVREDRAGRMRIDVFSGNTRVFSEWWVGQQAWQLPHGADEPVMSRGGRLLKRSVMGWSSRATSGPWPTCPGTDMRSRSRGAIRWAESRTTS
jgi:hypothetical protein